MITLGVMVWFLSLNVFETIDVVALGFTQTSSLSSPVSNAKRLLDSQFACLLECFGFKVLNSLWGIIPLHMPTPGDAMLLLQISMQFLHEVDDR